MKKQARSLRSTLSAFFHFGIFVLAAYFFSFILIISFRLSERYTAHFGLLLGAGITLYIQSLLEKNGKEHIKVRNYLNEAFLYLLLTEAFILTLSPVHSLVPEKLLLRTGILKNIDDVKDCEFEKELSKAKVFMKDEIDMSNLKIYYGGDADIASNFPKLLPPVKATTWGNMIYVSRKGSCVSDSLLVHELTHVWQYQNGYGFGPKWLLLWPKYFWRYFTDFDALYEFGSYKGLIKAESEGKKFSDFGLEQQAEIVSTYYYVITNYKSPTLEKSEAFKALKYFISQEFKF